MALNSLTNFIVYVDGVGYAGKVKQGTPPKITMITEEVFNGGMLGKKDIPMGAVEKMEFDFTLSEHNPVLESLLGQEDIGVTFRGVAGADNLPIIIEIRCLMKEIDPGTWEPAKASEIKISATASYYKKTIGTTVVQEIDVDNFVFKTGTIDLLAALRASLGL